MLKMRPEAKELVEAARACAAAKKPTNVLIHRVLSAAAQYAANHLGEAVRVVLPGGFVIERSGTAGQKK